MVTPTLLRPGEREEAAVVEAGEMRVTTSTSTTPPSPKSSSQTRPEKLLRGRGGRWEETPIRTEQQHSRDGGDHRDEHHHRHGPADNQEHADDPDDAGAP